jgi:hypothetical protein
MAATPPMSRIWSALGAILLGALAIKLFFDLIKPYAIWIVLGTLAYLIGVRVYNKSRRF